jgi:hypothetical protein
MDVSKLTILLMCAAIGVAALLTHLYEEHLRIEQIRQNAFHHTNWTADNRPADNY